MYGTAVTPYISNLIPTYNQLNWKSIAYFLFPILSFNIPVSLPFSFSFSCSTSSPPSLPHSLTPSFLPYFLFFLHPPTPIYSPTLSNCIPSPSDRKAKSKQKIKFLVKAVLPTYLTMTVFRCQLNGCIVYIVVLLFNQLFKSIFFDLIFLYFLSVLETFVVII